MRLEKPNRESIPTRTTAMSLLSKPGATEHPGVAGLLSPGSNSGDGILDSFLELSFEVAPVENFHRALQQLLELTAFDSWD